MRRKRRGDYHVWDSTIQAAISVGAVVTVGTNEDKPLVFTLPQDDKTYRTAKLHPIKREILDAIDVTPNTYDEDDYQDSLASKNRKRKRDPLFALEKSAQKYLRAATQEALSGPKHRDESRISRNNSTNSMDSDTAPPTSNKKSPVPRKTSGRWTAAEKRLFFEAVDKHGKNWSILSDTIASKTTLQIKNFYHDHKVQLGKKSLSGNDDGKAKEIGIPRKKSAGRQTPTEPTAAEFQEEQSRLEMQRQREALASAQAHRQAVFELAARRVAQEQSDPDANRVGRRTPEQDAWNKLQHLQQQQQQQAQEETRRLLQSQLGLPASALSNLPGIDRKSVV